MKPFRIGLLGGMGPLAGVELHRLVINATPAKADQDHFQVILFTDPKIPDRTTSLAEDDGRAFAAAAAASAQVLEQSGANVIAMACMSAHSRIHEIQAAVKIPILNGIELTRQEVSSKFSGQTVALLATTGSIKSGMYTDNNTTGIQWLIPDDTLQTKLMAGIYDIKGGEFDDGATKIIECLATLSAAGAQGFVLGCTELGLLHDQLKAQGYKAIDPMRLLARRLVEMGQAA